LATKAVEVLAAMDGGLRSRTIDEWTVIIGDEGTAREIVAALCEPDGRDPAKAAESKHVRDAATRSATLWIRLIQAQIQDRMG